MKLHYFGLVSPLTGILVKINQVCLSAALVISSQWCAKKILDKITKPTYQQDHSRVKEHKIHSSFYDHIQTYSTCFVLFWSFQFQLSYALEVWQDPSPPNSKMNSWLLTFYHKKLNYFKIFHYRPLFWTYKLWIIEFLLIPW